MTRSSLLRLFLLPTLALVAPAVVTAQFSGAIQGTITDAQKAVVASAVVIVTHTASGVTREATTTPEGIFRIPSLGPGTYRMQIAKQGFVTAKRENVVVGISETVRLDVTLEVSGVQESVTVTSTSPLVETEQGRVSGRVGSAAAAGDAAQRAQSLQPDRPAAGCDRQGRVRVDQRRRRRGRLVRRRIGAAHERERPA